MNGLVVTMLIGLVVSAHAQETQTVKEGIPSLLSINAIQIAKDIQNREPVEPGQTFSKDVRKLVCFVSIKNSGEPRMIEFRWLFQGKVVNVTEIEVGKSSRWRTWARKNILSTQVGSWSCEVHEKDSGDLLQKAEFTVTD
jgi:hypothetical protein